MWFISKWYPIHIHSLDLPECGYTLCLIPTTKDLIFWYFHLFFFSWKESNFYRFGFQIKSISPFLRFSSMLYHYWYLPQFGRESSLSWKMETHNKDMNHWEHWRCIPKCNLMCMWVAYRWVNFWSWGIST